MDDVWVRSDGDDVWVRSDGDDVWVRSVGHFSNQIYGFSLGDFGSPDPFASLPLPSCDPRLSEGLLPLVGPGEGPLVGPGEGPLVGPSPRRCWDSEPLRPDYGPSSLDLVSVCMGKGVVWSGIGVVERV